MRAEGIAALLEAGDRKGAETALDAALTARHASGAARELCALHRLAARFWEGDADRAAFHLTHAYVHALEAGDDAATRTLHAALAAMGRV